jgi:hypothetical protein
MSDLRERMRAAAAEPARDVAPDDVRRRGTTLRRRRTMTRAAAPALVALALVVGVMARVHDDDVRPTLTDDPATTTTTVDVDHPDVPAPQTGASSPSTTTTTTAPGHVPGIDAHAEMTFADRAGDTRSDVATGIFAARSGGLRHPEPELDVVAGRIAVDADLLEVTIAVDDLTDDPPAGADGGGYDALFTIWDDGEQLASRVSLQRYNGVEDVHVVVFAQLTECRECTVVFDAATDEVRAVVPLAVIDRLLHDQGYDGLSPGDRFAGPGAETRWIFTDRSTPGQQTGTFGGAIADTAAGPGRSFTL